MPNKERIAQILTSAGNPAFAVYVHTGADGNRIVESVGRCSMSDYAASLSDEQYQIIARSIAAAMRDSCRA